MKAVRKNGVTTLTLEKPEIKVLRKAVDILVGVHDLAQDDASVEAATAYEAIESVLGRLESLATDDTVLAPAKTKAVA